MNIQNYILCILYIFLIISHSFTICEKDFHRKLISIFSFALFTETFSVILLTVHQIVLTYGQDITAVTNVDLGPMYNIHYFAQLIHIISINFFILFLLIIAKGWPITRRDMPFKFAFTIFWILCLSADLITFYWTTLTIIAKNLASDYNSTSTLISSMTNITITSNEANSSSPIWNDSATKLSTSIIDSLPNDTEQFNTTPKRLKLVLRVVIMLYFLLELRTTMILEQEKRNLQFYLQFGALTMVWFINSLIVYVISLRVEIVWQSKLISGFSSAANFLAFAVATSLLWPSSSRSYLFRKHKRNRPASLEDADLEDPSNNLNDDDDYCDEYDGLEMKDLRNNSSEAEVAGTGEAEADPSYNKNTSTTPLSIDPSQTSKLQVPGIKIERISNEVRDQNMGEK